MKSIKIIILFATISLFTSVPYNVAESRDCSNPKGFHEKLMCKVSGSTSSEPSTKTKKKKNGESFWQKIKNFGGKNVGEAG